MIRLAREYEQLRGPDLEGFVRFLEEQADLATREGEAAIADEGGDAVLLMTIHAAKGLEFPVVVVADLGKKFNLRSGTTGVMLTDRYGLAILDHNMAVDSRLKREEDIRCLNDSPSTIAQIDRDSGADVPQQSVMILVRVRQENCINTGPRAIHGVQPLGRGQDAHIPKLFRGFSAESRRL